MLNFFKRNFLNNRTASKINYTLVGFEKAREMIENNEVVLVDVRTSKEYNQFHVLNAINIPVEDICNGNINIENNCKIMLYCATGTRSKTAIKQLNKLGYNNIYIWEYASLTTFPYKKLLIYNK